jgi:hypothetical protein
MHESSEWPIVLFHGEWPSKRQKSIGVAVFIGKPHGIGPVDEAHASLSGRSVKSFVIITTKRENGCMVMN